MSNSIRFDVVLPCIIAQQLNTEEDMTSLLTALKSGQKTLFPDPKNPVNVNTLQIVNGTLAQVTFSNYRPNNPVTQSIAAEGDYIVWNQKNVIHIVQSKHYNQEWSDDLIPACLLLPVATRKIV